MSGRVGFQARSKPTKPLLPHHSHQRNPLRKSNYKYHILLLMAALTIFGGVVIVIVLPPGYTPPPKPHVDPTEGEAIEVVSNITCQARTECSVSNRLIDFANCTTCSQNSCVTSTPCPENWYCGFFYNEMCVERNRLTCSAVEDCNVHFGGGKQYCSRCVEGQCVATKKCRSGEICDGESKCIKDVTTTTTVVQPVSEAEEPVVQQPQSVTEAPVGEPEREEAPVSPPIRSEPEILTIDELGRRCQLTKFNATVTHPADAEALDQLSSWMLQPPVSWRIINSSNACGKWFGITCEPCCNYTNYLCVQRLDISGYSSLRTKPDANVTLEGFLNLRHVDLSNNPMGPAWPRRLPLTTMRLYMKNCNFSGPLTDELKSLSYLKVLDVSMNEGTGSLNVSESIPNSVVSLNVSSNKFGAIVGISSESSIAYLQAHNNTLTLLDSAPKAIRILNVSNNELSELPSQLSEAYALQEIDFSANSIIRCPEVMKSTSQPILERCNADVNPMHCNGEPSTNICRGVLHPVCINDKYGSEQNCYGRE